MWLPVIRYRIATGLISGRSRRQFPGTLLRHKQSWPAGRQQCHCWWQWVDHFPRNWHFPQILNVKAKEITPTLRAMAVLQVMSAHHYVEELEHWFIPQDTTPTVLMSVEVTLSSKTGKNAYPSCFYAELTQWTCSVVINQVFIIIIWFWRICWLVTFRMIAWLLTRGRILYSKTITAMVATVYPLCVTLFSHWNT